MDRGTHALNVAAVVGKGDGICCKHALHAFAFMSKNDNHFVQTRGNDRFDDVGNERLPPEVEQQLVLGFHPFGGSGS